MDTWPSGVGCKSYPTLDSTNSEAVRLAGSGERGPLWVFAAEQTGGRGRRGRVWHGGAGNFYASLLMRPDGPPADAALRSFVAALAVRDAVAAVIGTAEGICLKWPNDVLVNGRKLAGILLEGGDGYLCIGVGVNLLSAPPVGVLDPGAVAAISLQEARGVRVDAQEFLTVLAADFARREETFRTYGFAPVRRDWLQHAARLGEIVTARMPGRTEIGRFETIDETGAIVLQTARGKLALPAAEIFFED